MSIKLMTLTIDEAIHTYREAQAKYDAEIERGMCPSTLDYEIPLMDIGRALMGLPIVVWERGDESLDSCAPPRSMPVEKVILPSDIRWHVWERDDFTCRCCGVRRNLSLDHIVPESKGGAHTADNLQTLCRSCNSRKGPR